MALSRVRVIAVIVSRLLVLISVPAAAWAQLQPGKDLWFAQIAFGGSYETVLNLTNRGTSTYSYRLSLLPSDPTKPFPALVNGNPVSGGTDLTLDPGATVSLRITTGNAAAGVLSGFATIAPKNRASAGLIEGNLTYFVRSAAGAIVDSVGVAPSRPIFQTVVPFDDFQTIAVALANHNPSPNPANTATIKMALFGDNNAQIRTVDQVLSGNQQVAKFLSEFFPGVSLTKGRIEIHSDRRFIGTAVTFVSGGQTSSLPFLPSMKLYRVAFTLEGETVNSHLYIASDGHYVVAYHVDLESGEPVPDSTALGTGTTINRNLDLYFREEEDKLVIHVTVPQFSPLEQTQNGSVRLFTIDPPGLGGVGTVTLTAIN